MRSFFLLFLLFFSLVVFFTSCGGNATDTPPIVGPDDREDVLPPSDGDQLDPTQSEPELFPDDPDIEKCDPQDENCSQGTPATLIRSSSGAFVADQVVFVGVILPSRFFGRPPLVGPAVPSEGLPGLSRNTTVSSDGSVVYGVYVDALTTPGTYTFYASQGSRRLTTTIRILQAD